MTSREVIQRLTRLGCKKVRQKGSHKFFVSSCGKCRTTVPDHTGDMRIGTLRQIEKDMTPCLGNDWLKGSK